MWKLQAAPESRMFWGNLSVASHQITIPFIVWSQSEMKHKKPARKTASSSSSLHSQSIKSTCYMCSSRGWRFWCWGWVQNHFWRSEFCLERAHICLRQRETLGFISALVRTAMFLGRPLCRTIVWNILYLIVVPGGGEESLTRHTFEQKNDAVQRVKYENNVDFCCLLWFVQSKTLPAEIILAFRVESVLY